VDVSVARKYATGGDEILRAWEKDAGVSRLSAMSDFPHPNVYEGHTGRIVNRLSLIRW
jgi:hypothetical protein